MSVPDRVNRAYSYLRFSTSKQLTGDSFRRQKAMAEDYAARHGLVLDETLTFEDLGISAFRSRNAKTGALRAFLDAVESGLVCPGSILLVESLDRISRDQILAAVGVFLQIISASITVVTLIDGRSYSQSTINTNPLEFIILLVTMIRANEESAVKSTRLKENWARRRALGNSKVMTGIGPAWLAFDKKARKYRVIERHAAVVRRIFADYLSGLGRPAIAKALTQEGCPKFTDPRSSSEWRQSTIDRLLKSPMVIGTLIPTKVVNDNGTTKRVCCEPILNYYPAIISMETYEAAQVERKARKPNRTFFSEPLRNVLSGLARCYSCGKRMRFQSCTDNTYPAHLYLHCRGRDVKNGCRTAWIRYEAVQAAILTRSVEVFRTREKIVQKPSDDRHHTSKYLDSTETALSEDVVASGILANYFMRYQHLCEMPSIDLEQINQLLRKCFDSVIVDQPTNRLIFRWRDGAVGSLRSVWPDSYRPRVLWPEGQVRGVRKLRADRQTMHEAYGLLNGKSNAHFPLLTLAQVDEALERYRSGEPAPRIAAELGVALNTLMKRLNPRRKDAIVRTRAPHPEA
jgi:DNA invertase Pin-like site-specific DNA recombinase